ncbi:hypothetical protein ACN4EG_08725 [Alkalinema pantanalense CENA528]|uniref:hypothetical protein n=1 Tax=Alkalinema pantanalense TaxID=1620705 RepID=UPI003D6EA9C3
MYSSRHLFAFTAIAVTLGSLAVGCDSKVSQCNKLVKVTNEATTELQAASKGGGDQIGKMKQMTGILEKNIQAFQAVEVKDEKLKGFQQRFVDLYTKTRDASKNLVDAAGRKDVKAMQASLQSMQSSSKDETSLISEINGYCQAK